MRPSRVRVSALLFATVATLAAIVLVAGGVSRPAALAVVHSAAPQTRIFKLTNTLQGLPQLIAARRALAGSTPNAEDAAAAAQLAFALFQSSGNARFLAAANSAIAAWEHTPQPPPAVWVWRGRLLQTQHRFVEAAHDLAAFNHAHGGSTEALLLEADAWRHAGMTGKSKHACLQLALLGRVDLASYCAADVLLSVGHSREALSLLATVTDSAGLLPTAEREWGRAILADALSANGDPLQAAAVWESIVSSTAAPLSYKLGYADVLLSLSRYDKVLAVLGEDVQSTAALLRLTVAASRLGHDNAAMWQPMLQRRMALTARTAAADIHLREQALYTLWVEGNAEKSLQLAVRNWELQKGWEDAQLVLHIAAALNRNAEIRLVRDWQEKHATGAST